MQNKLLVLLFLLSGLTAQAPCHADEYHFGQGLLVGKDFFFSGYGNFLYEAPKDAPAAVSIDDLSLFVSGRVNQWINPFFEIEVSGTTLWQQGNGSRSNGYVIPERIYDDVRITESDAVRVGKILSPVGDWNLIHAAPLVPTTTRPLTTYWGFSEYATGISWLHENLQGSGADWQLYSQPGNEWFPRPNDIAPRHYSNVWGGHINWPMGLVDKIGLSFQHGELTATGGNYSLFGINARKTFGKLKLESEAVTSQRSGNAALAHGNEWGIYGLADYAITPRWHGLFEWEHYQDHLVDQHSRNTLLGIAYKPESSVVWKLEYVHQYGISQDIPTGWKASLSALF